jgi:hypothetical protein
MPERYELFLRRFPKRGEEEMQHAVSGYIDCFQKSEHLIEHCKKDKLTANRFAYVASEHR